MKNSALLAGIDKMKKAELTELCEEKGIDPPKTVADMRYVLKKHFEDAENGGGDDDDDSDSDSSSPKAKTKAKGKGKAKGSLKEVSGEIVQPKGTGKRLLVHTVAKGLKWSPKGTMGRITTTFGQEPRVQHDGLSGTLSLGSVQFVNVSGGNTVASILCQSKPAPGNVPPMDLKAFTKGLKAVAEAARKDSASVHISKFDPRTPGASQDDFSEAIENTLVSQGVQVYIYTRPSGGTSPTVQKPVKKKKKLESESEEEEEEEEEPPKKQQKKAKGKKKKEESEEEEEEEEPPKKQQKKAKGKKKKEESEEEEEEEEKGDFDQDARRKEIVKKIKGKSMDDFPLEDAKAEIVSLEKDSEEFWRVEEKFYANMQGRNEDYVAKRIKKGLMPIKFVLIGAQRVLNTILECRYEIKRRELLKSRLAKEVRERVAFHGTHPKNCSSICKTSLLRFQHKLNPCKKQVDDGYFGSNKKGVYVSRYADYTLKYANNVIALEPKEAVKTILFRTLPGKSKHIPSLCGPIDPTEGFDSHSSPEFLEWFLFDEAQLCPEYILQVRAEEDTRTKSDDQ